MVTKNQRLFMLWVTRTTENTPMVKLGCILKGNSREASSWTDWDAFQNEIQEVHPHQWTPGMRFTIKNKRGILTAKAYL